MTMQDLDIRECRTLDEAMAPYYARQAAFRKRMLKILGVGLLKLTAWLAFVIWFLYWVLEFMASS